MFLMDGEYCLWGDTLSTNIKKYYDRIFMPMAMKLGIGHLFKYYEKAGMIMCLNQKNDMNRPGICDLRSAAIPSNWEGEGYGKIIINEGGIVLQDPMIQQAVMPMFLGQEAITGRPTQGWIGGTPKGKIIKKSQAVKIGDNTAPYYKLYMDALSDDNPIFCLPNKANGHKPYTMYDNIFATNNERKIVYNSVPKVFRDQEIHGLFTGNVGAVIEAGWIKEKFVDMDKIEHIVIGVDLAISVKDSADYSAIVVCGNDSAGNIYVIDTYRFKSSSYNVICENIIKMARQYGAEDIVVEAVQYQAGIVDKLIRITNDYEIIGVRPTKDKLTRFLPTAQKYEVGQIIHNVNLEKTFITELLNFSGIDDSHDDYIDALAYATKHITEKYLGINIGMVF
ncbi:MAG: phage terminase large subunit [PVC group bacterium]|nr:phage terminase large subunit [PVC group bacterium]